jgi:Xaa-Pro aminopeptidase
MSPPSGYSGAKVELVERDIKADQTDSFISRTLKSLAALKKVGIFLTDNDDGDLTEVTKSQLKKQGVSFVEMKDFVDSANTVKSTSEISNLRVASDFADWTFKKVINEVETILENDKVTKHSAI